MQPSAVATSAAAKVAATISAAQTRKHHAKGSRTANTPVRLALATNRIMKAQPASPCKPRRGGDRLPGSGSLEGGQDLAEQPRATVGDRALELATGHLEVVVGLPCGLGLAGV